MTSLLIAMGHYCLANTASDDAFNFLVMGDWGGQGEAPYTTQAEVDTAAGMGKVAGEQGSRFAMALGDNFYSKGITTDEFDMRFEHTFENVFTSSNLMGQDYFRVLLGNHDHYGNVTAQVEYSKHSSRWRMDDLYWSFEEKTQDNSTSVKFVMIDTVTLSGIGHKINELTGEYYTPHGDALPGPADQDFADNQWAWIENELESASDADYLIVAGHYPVYSICEHGPTKILVSRLKPLLDKYHATAYINGHDHCQEHIEVDGVAYHTIGSAHGNDPSTAHESAIPKDSLKFHIGEGDGQGGFGLISVSSTGLTVQHIAGNGTTVYTAPPLSPRSKRPSPSPVKPGSWKCYTSKKFKNSLNLDDKDNKERTTLSACQKLCSATPNCHVIALHHTDGHCHVYTGSITQDEFTQELSDDSSHDVCFQSPAKALVSSS